MIHEVKNIQSMHIVRQGAEELSRQDIIMVKEESEGNKALSMDEIEAIIKEMNEFIRIFNTKVAFELDKETGKMILRIIDVQTNEVIRQIPPEELLRISKRISELLGLIINARV